MLTSSAPPPSSHRRRSVWAALSEHAGHITGLHLNELFAADPRRCSRMQIESCGLLLDYSKNRVNEETLQLLNQLAHACDLPAQRAAMFGGERINLSERRSVLHTALRRPSDQTLLVDGRDIMADIRHVRARIDRFAEQVRSGEWRGRDGGQITDVINLGIGGSDLGPRLGCEALQQFAHPRLRFHFIANVDGIELGELLDRLDPVRCLFIIASKSFTTTETIVNARTVRQWFIERTGSESGIDRHFVAVSSNVDAALAFGVQRELIFPLWNWVGGRYSLWSAIGLPLVLQIGPARFAQLLAGAHAMDEHFCQAPPESNMPTLLALLSVWNTDFLHANSQLVAPYHQRLRHLPVFLQQLEMESNGKSVARDGGRLEHAAGQVLWGNLGIHGQHAYFQLLHQGSQLVPVDFIGVLEPDGPFPAQQRIAFANLLAQAEALMRGQSEAEAEAQMKARGLSAADIAHLLPHCQFHGNRPSNILLLERLDPHTLGALIALYEHRTFVQGILWDINSFDQWGVELGKRLAQHITTALVSGPEQGRHDPSTASLIKRFHQHWPEDSARKT